MILPGLEAGFDSLQHRVSIEILLMQHVCLIMLPPRGPLMLFQATLEGAAPLVDETNGVVVGNN